MLRTSAILCAVMLVFASGNTPAQQKPSRALPTRGAFPLQPVRHLRPDVDLRPLLAHPKTTAERSVNEALARWNEQAKDDLDRCDDALRDEGHSPTDDDYNRYVTVTMNGPRFLSMVAKEGFFCGGGHPDGYTIALVFDMQTGALVNWTSFNSSPTLAVFPSDPNQGDEVNSIALPALRELYIAAAIPECKDAFEFQKRFLLWPDAKSGNLIAQSVDMGHANIPCVSEFPIAASLARALGFSDDLLTAIAAAHRRYPSPRKTQTAPNAKH